jgi:hypothetical protein
MYVQKLVSLKNIKQINKWLEQGWRFVHAIPTPQTGGF